MPRPRLGLSGFSSRKGGKPGPARNAAIAAARSGPRRTRNQTTAIRAETQVIGLTKGGRNSKIHAVVDEECRPWVFVLTPDNTADCVVAAISEQPYHRLAGPAH